MSRQLELVVQGVLGTNPTVSRTPSDRAYLHARLATTPTFRTDEGWRDGETIWFTLKAWGALAENLGHSLHKGDPVVMVGRFTQETWTSERGEQVSNVLTVTCGGHDLTRGESRFMRVRQGSADAASAAPAAAGGSPETAASPELASSPDAAEAGEGGLEGPDKTLAADHWENVTPPGDESADLLADAEQRDYVLVTDED